MRGLCKVVLTLFLLNLLACETKQQKGNRIAKQYCGSCHLFPEPSLLDKATWEKGILPSMGYRLGVNTSLLDHYAIGDKLTSRDIFPDKPVVSQEEWKAIVHYYLTEAPDSLVASPSTIIDTVKQFKARSFKLPGNNSMISLIHANLEERKFYIGDTHSRLFRYNFNLTLEDSIQLDSPPAHCLTAGLSEPLALLIGIMHPNDYARGKVIQLGQKNDHHTLIDSIKRPVFFERVDLNNDSLKDLVVSAFGHYTGDLSVYEQQRDSTFEKHILNGLPGARKTISADFDGDGDIDIMALMTQGDEQIILYENQGNLIFETITLLKFPPVYGSSYFELQDFNKDGRFDILYTNGDNADYSPIDKPYHGIRIFLNVGKNSFKESWFFPLQGTTQAMARDFDNDGDLDIAAIAFFVNLSTTPDRGFVYFENTKDGYIPQILQEAKAGRWIVMEEADLENDGDTDLILGSFAFPSKVPTAIYERWLKEQISLLVLTNTSN